MRNALLSLAVLLFAIPVASAQTVYRWVDDEGEIHYTDDKKSIPADKLKAAEVTKGVEIGIAPSNTKTPAATAAAQADDDAAEKARLVEEREWRSRFKEKHARIERLEKAILMDRKILQDPGSAGLPVGRVDRRGMVQPLPEVEAVKKRLESEEKDLLKAREDLNDLDREAASKAIPLEWRR